MATITTDPIDRNFPPATQASIWPTAVKWGLIAGVITSVLTLISYNLGMMDIGEDGTPPSSWLASLISFIIVGVTIFLGQKAYRDGANGGYLTLGRAVLWTLGFSVVLGAISAVFTYLFYGVLAPDYLSDLKEAQMDAAVEQGVDEASIEAMETGLDLMMSPGAMALSALIGLVIITLILGLIIGLFVRRER